MTSTSYKNYRKADIGTADRGKLVIMVYDHCINWLKRAEGEAAAQSHGDSIRSLQKVQAGLTELMCSLDMEVGGAMARDLFSLYDFYSRHLTQAVTDKSVQPIRDVEAMMVTLRGAWLGAIENVRKEGGVKFPEKPVGLSIVS